MGGRARGPGKGGIWGDGKGGLLGMGVLTVAPNPLFIDEGTGKASGVVALKPGDFSRDRVGRRGLPGMD